MAYGRLRVIGAFPLHAAAILLACTIGARPAGAGLQSVGASVAVTVRSGSYPMQGVLVRANGVQARTGPQGRAHLSLPPGRHEIIVSAEGFHELRLEVEVSPGGTVEVEADLIPIVSVTEEVTVTATRTEHRLQDEPVRVEVVDREDIEEKALMTPGSVAMLLGETTGLRVQTTSPSLGAANVRIQGLRGRYTQLLSDGLPLYGGQGDSFSMLQVPPLDLSQVEIIKGAASALYGSSALGGVINLVSQHPSARARQVLFNAGTQGAGDAVFWIVEPPRGRWAWTILGGLHGQRQQDIDDDGWTDIAGYRRGVIRPRLFWDNGSGRTVFATAGVIAEDRWGGTLEGRDAPDGRPFEEALDSRRVDGGVVARFALANGALLSLRGSVAFRGERRVFGDVLERGDRFTGFGEAVWQRTMGRHSWLIGGALQQELYDARDFPAFDYSYAVPGFFLQDEIALWQGSTAGISARLDRHNRYGTFVSPRLSLLQNLDAGWSIRLSLGTGFFAPTPFVEETEETGLSRLEPLSGLRAERARSASLDVGWSIGKLDVTGTVFGSHVGDPVQHRIVGPESVALQNADGPVRTWGTELLARYRLEGFLILATHGYTRSTERNPESTGRRPVPLTPGHMASFNAIWEGSRWGRVGVEAYYVGRQPLEENPYRSVGRGHLLFGFLAERRFGRVRVFVNLENLGDIRQTRWDPLVRPARAPDGRWTVDAWAPLDGRTANAGVRVFF